MAEPTWLVSTLTEFKQRRQAKANPISLHESYAKTTAGANGPILCVRIFPKLRIRRHCVFISLPANETVDAVIKILKDNAEESGPYEEVVLTNGMEELHAEAHLHEVTWFTWPPEVWLRHGLA